jgi:(R,R)-butanediol dehydrogenase/meso-butanediol dehydrogenase/diacetyl reductase
MITNAVSLIGSRGHLGGAFAKILGLHRNGRLSIDDAATDIINGPEEICNLLKSPGKLFEKNCKVLVNFDANRD